MIRVNKTFTRINLYKNIKSVLYNNHLKISSITNNSNDQIENEEVLEFNDIFRENTLIAEIKRAEKTGNLKEIRAHTLLNNCGANFVDVFHDKRQYYLNYLFNTLFVPLGYKFKQENFDSYTKNTLDNLSSFDPFNISNEMSKYDLKGNLSINTCLIKQLCEINKINYALVHLKSIVQSNNLDLIDLKNYNNSPYINNNNVYELFQADINNLNLKHSTNYIHLFNPILEKLMDLNDLKNSFNLLELIDKLNLKPNNKTYLNLINGYLKKLNYEETLNNLDKYHKYLKLNDKLELYLTNCLINKNDLKQQDYINLCLFDKIQTEFDQNDRIIFINIIMRLCKENMFDEAFYLVSNFFRNDLFEIDAEIKETKLNLGDFFFKSLIKYENSFINLLKYANKQGDLEKNYKSLLYHSLIKQDSEMSLKIIQEFLKNNFELKSCYFFPILVREANNLNEYLKVNKNEEEIEKQISFKRIVSILGKIRYEYNLFFNVEDLNTLLNLLKFEDKNEPKKYLKYIHIAKLFDRAQAFDTNKIFTVFSYKILSYRRNNIRNSRNSKDFFLDKEQIDDDLNELYNLIKYLNITQFDQKFFIMLNNYLYKLFNTNLVYDKTNLIENTTIYKLVRLINKQSIEQSELLKTLNDNLLDFALTNLRENRTKQEVKDIFEEMTNNSIKQTPKKNKYPIAGFENKNETIESLTNLYNEMKEKGKQTSGSIIRLLIEFCNSSDNYIKDPIYLIQKYTEMLPEDKYTPLLCENLMAFYAEKTFNIEKATMYYSKLKISNQGTFDVNPIKLLPYLENLYKNYPDIKNINNVFKSLSWNQSNEDNTKAFNRLIGLLSGKLFEKTSSNDYKDLIENIFQSNFMGRNETIINLAMLKYFKTKEIDEAFEYFKSNLIKYKISASEILLLKEYLKLHKEKKMKEEKLEELLNFFSKHYDANLAYNFFFWAYILNGNFESASPLYHQSLGKKLDLNVLKRLSKQLNSNKLYAKYLHCLRKIIKFKPIMQNESLYAEFTNIIDKKD